MQLPSKILLNSGYRFCLMELEHKKTLSCFWLRLYYHVSSCTCSGYITSLACYKNFLKFFLQWCKLHSRMLFSCWENTSTAQITCVHFDCFKISIIIKISLCRHLCTYSCKW
jgi:hypothetical protein